MIFSLFWARLLVMELALKILVPTLIAIASYFIKRSIDKIDEEITHTKTSIQAMSKRLSSIETNSALILHDFSKQTAIMAAVESDVKKLDRSATDQLNRVERVTDAMLTDVTLVKENYGKVILVLKQLVNQKTKKNP